MIKRSRAMDFERCCPAGGLAHRAGIVVRGLGPALVAAVVIGLLNATVGFVLKIITFPISILTLGLVSAGHQWLDDSRGLQR